MIETQFVHEYKNPDLNLRVLVTPGASHSNAWALVTGRKLRS